ncbi:MAG: MraY family glycosyltransferase [Bacteroidales bacterium]|nr:MraY family glycosyltransferase [Bacteroidales bacterium]MDY6001305.1 MraY family glycosyltransferase [Candidatus Cryptobacteroides sp.]
MQFLVLIFALAISTLLGIVIIPKIIIISKKKHLYDSTNVRKIHNGKISRLGGVSFSPNSLITLCITLALTFWLSQDGLISFPTRTDAAHFYIEFLLMCASMAILFLVGLADDLVGIRYRIKFIFQIICCIIIMMAGVIITDFCGFWGLYSIPTWLGIGLSFFVIIFITNAINLIDGMDGLASGLAIVSLVTFLIVFTKGGLLYYSECCVALLGTLAVFWLYNTFGDSAKGKKIFMGDSGSLSIGFILSLMLIKLDQNVGSPKNTLCYKDMVLAASTLIVPVFDALRVAGLRVLNKRNPFLPDKNHIHHRLNRAGIGKMYVTICVILFDIFFVALNYVMAFYLNVTWILLIDILAWVLTHKMLSRRIKAYEVKNHMAHDIAGNQFTIKNPAHYGMCLESNFIVTKTPEESALPGNYEIHALEDLEDNTR